MTRVLSSVATGFLVLLIAFRPDGEVFAQDSRSAPLAIELTTLMQRAKLDVIASKLPTTADQFVAALFFPTQLLVVSARYSAPPVLNEKILRNEHREVYIDLNAASIPESKILITDTGADGLRPKPMANQLFDSQDIGLRSIRFDGNWRQNKMSEQEYLKVFAEAEQIYILAVQALIAAIKKA
jgi:hypothetical protein